MNYDQILEMNKIRESIIWVSRFIINLTPEELAPNRYYWLTNYKAAFWYYNDHIYRKGTGVELQQNFFYYWISQPVTMLQDIHKNLKEYVSIFFELIRYLKLHKDYSRTISLYGAILVNQQMDSVLVVMNYRQTVYSFPKGKVNQNEDGVQCAIREVWEEVGYQIGKKISPNDFVEFTCEETGQRQRLYIVLDVNEKENFQTNTRYEIGKIEWIKINDILRLKQHYSTLFPYMYGITKYISYAKSSHGSNRNQSSPQLGDYIDISQYNQVEELVQQDVRPRKIKNLASAPFKLEGQAYKDMEMFENKLKGIALEVVRSFGNELRNNRTPIEDYGFMVWE